MIASVCRRILPTLAGCGARLRGLWRSLIQSSQSSILALLPPWLARCMQSSQGILTAFLRMLLPRLDGEAIQAGFDMGVGGGGGAMGVVSLQVRSRSVKETCELSLGVSSGSVKLSIIFTASSAAFATSATGKACGLGKQINAFCTLPPGVILHDCSAIDSGSSTSRADLQHANRPGGRRRAMLAVGLSKQT